MLKSCLAAFLVPNSLSEMSVGSIQEGTDHCVELLPCHGSTSAIDGRGHPSLDLGQEMIFDLEYTAPTVLFHTTPRLHVLHSVGKLDVVACVRVDFGPAVNSWILSPLHDAEVEATHVLQPVELTGVFEVRVVSFAEHGFLERTRSRSGGDPGHNHVLLGAVQEERQRLVSCLLADTADIWTCRAHERSPLGVEIRDSELVDVVAKLSRQVREARKFWVLIRLSESVDQHDLGPIEMVSDFDPKDRWFTLASAQAHLHPGSCFPRLDASFDDGLAQFLTSPAGIVWHGVVPIGTS